MGVAVALVAGALVVSEPASGGGTGGGRWRRGCCSLPARCSRRSRCRSTGRRPCRPLPLDADTHVHAARDRRVQDRWTRLRRRRVRVRAGPTKVAIDNCFDSPAGTDLGIGIDDANVGATTKSAGLGSVSTTPIEYTADFVGTGNPISVNYHDCGHSDNGPAAGRLPLTLSIFGPRHREEPGPGRGLRICPTSAPAHRARRCTRRTTPTRSLPIALVGPERLIAFDLAATVSRRCGTSPVTPATGAPVRDPLLAATVQGFAGAVEHDRHDRPPRTPNGAPSWTTPPKNVSVGWRDRAICRASLDICVVRHLI